jgi:ribosomal protein S18 acetylase RimI-like enzyme
MLVRGATPDDIRAIATIHVETWRAAYAGTVPAAHLAALSIDEREVRWGNILATSEAPTLVVEGERGVVGWCSYGKSRDPDRAPETGELWAIYVAPAHWSTGAGRALWLEARRALFEGCFCEATVWVFRGNARAIRFYERAGFVLEPGIDKTVTIGGAALVEVRLRAPLSSL